MKKQKTIKNKLFKRMTELSTFYKVSGVLRSSFDFDKLLNEIIILAVREMDAEVGSIMLLEDDELVVRACCGEDGFNRKGAKRRIGNGISGWVAKKGTSLLIEDISTDPNFKHHFNPRYKSTDLLSAPIMIKDKLFGVININYKKSGGPFKKTDLQLLVVIATSIAIVIDNFKLIEDIRLKERLSTIGELTAKLAHEIRNPLNGIKMNVQILQKKTRGQGLEEHYDIILGEIKRLDNLLKSILDHSKAQKSNKELLDIHKILDKVLSIISLNEPKVKIRKRYKKVLPLFSGDADKLEQAFLNICLNAVHAMEGEGTLSLSTRIYKSPETATIEKKNFIRIDFSDTGHGIQKEDREKIFSPFYTTRPAGTGVGLSITERIVKLHNGKISFTSIIGKGTTFKVLLPIGEKSYETTGKHKK